MGLLSRAESFIICIKIGIGQRRLKIPLRRTILIAKSNTGTECILLVDDEAALANAGKHMLESLGYEVVIRTDSKEALEVFNFQPDRFDLVITDMTMPGLTGDQLARAMMGIRSDIPVILCTGFSARINEEKSLAPGIRAFVTKPVLKMQLGETIRKVLDEKSG